MVDLLSQEVTMSSQTLKNQDERERLLTGEHIFQAIQGDPLLKHKLEQAFRTMEDNEYFRVTPREDLAIEKGDKYSSLYTRELYEYLLLKTGHLVKGPEI